MDPFNFFFFQDDEKEKVFVFKQSQTTEQSITQNILPFFNVSTHKRHERRSGGRRKTLKKNLHFTSGENVLYRFL
jgi:hypothetical protein